MCPSEGEGARCCNEEFRAAPPPTAHQGEGRVSIHLCVRVPSLGAARLESSQSDLEL